MDTRGMGLDRLFGSRCELRPRARIGTPVIAFGIGSCVVAMLVVFAVMLAA
jgi:hypothetical protein